jgi:hypothetical protein
MDPVRQSVGSEIERRWLDYERRPNGRWPLTRRDAEVQEILDGNVEAFERARPRGSEVSFLQAQQLIVDTIQSMEERSGGWRSVVDLVLDCALHRRADRGGEGPLRLLEAASGSGWLQLRLAHRARERGLAVELTASDSNPELVESLDKRLRSAGVPAEARLADARDLPEVPDGRYDAAFMTYTLHHLAPPDAALCLRELDRVSAGGLVLVDVARRPLNLLLIPLATRLFASRAGRPFAAHDGWASICRGYTWRELALLLEWLGLAGRYRVGPLPTWHPQRLIANAIWPA